MNSCWILRQMSYDLTLNCGRPVISFFSAAVLEARAASTFSYALNMWLF